MPQPLEEKQMSYLGRIGSVAALLCAVATALQAPLPAEAQSLSVSSTTTMGLVRAQGVGPHYTVVNEFNKLWRNTAKTQALLRFAKSTFRMPATCWPENGMMVRYLVRFSTSSAYGDMWLRTLIVPLSGTGSRGETAALLISYYESTPQLALARLIVREWPGRDWSPNEYCMSAAGRIEELSGKKGQCLLRSSLKLLEAKNPVASRSLYASLRSTANAHMAVALQAVIDPRAFPVGQGEMLVAIATFTSASVEKEYTAGYVSGTIDNCDDLRFNSRDSSVLSQIKQLLRDGLKDLAKNLGKRLLDWLLSIFGF